MASFIDYRQREEQYERIRNKKEVHELIIQSHTDNDKYEKFKMFERSVIGQYTNDNNGYLRRIINLIDHSSDSNLLYVGPEFLIADDQPDTFTGNRIRDEIVDFARTFLKHFFQDVHYRQHFKDKLFATAIYDTTNKRYKPTSGTLDVFDQIFENVELHATETQLDNFGGEVHLDWIPVTTNTDQQSGELVKKFTDKVIDEYPYLLNRFKEFLKHVTVIYKYEKEKEDGFLLYENDPYYIYHQFIKGDHYGTTPEMLTRINNQLVYILFHLIKDLYGHYEGHEVTPSKRRRFNPGDGSKGGKQKSKRKWRKQRKHHSRRRRTRH